MVITNNTDTITIDDLTLQKKEIASVESEPFIQKGNFEAPNPANALNWNVTVKLNMSGGRCHVIDLKKVSNQATWFNNAWTTLAQLQGGLAQAQTDITGWL